VGLQKTRGKREGGEANETVGRGRSWKHPSFILHGTPPVSGWNLWIVVSTDVVDVKKEKDGLSTFSTGEIPLHELHKNTGSYLFLAHPRKIRRSLCQGENLVSLYYFLPDRNK